MQSNSQIDFSNDRNISFFAFVRHQLMSMCRIELKWALTKLSPFLLPQHPNGPWRTPSTLPLGTLFKPLDLGDAVHRKLQAFNTDCVSKITPSHSLLLWGFWQISTDKWKLLFLSIKLQKQEKHKPMDLSLSLLPSSTEGWGEVVERVYPYAL